MDQPVMQYDHEGFLSAVKWESIPTLHPFIAYTSLSLKDSGADLQWLLDRRRGTPWTGRLGQRSATCGSRASSGSLELLQWLLITLTKKDKKATGVALNFHNRMTLKYW